MLGRLDESRREVPLHHPAAAAACGTAPPSIARRAAVRSGAGAALVALAVLAQGWMVSADEGDRAGVMMLAGAAACALAFAWVRRRALAHLDVLVATAAVGGLAMLGGAYATGGHTHGAMDGDTPLVSTVGTGLMLAACAAACHWTCAPLCGGSWKRRAAVHLGAAVAMVGGMFVSGALMSHLSHRLMQSLDPTPLSAVAHLAMVLGMTAGMAAALPLIRWVDGSSAVARSAQCERAAA